MPNSTNEEEDQRKNANMEDSTMTIDFLRARLLSERSVSSSARQRAEELAKRVVDLEEQLKIVSLQRKKAEKATTDLLAILESNGISDVSGEEYDSRSDQEGSISDSRFDKNSGEEDEASPNEKVRSSLNGRSLSWKCGKNSSLSTDKKIYSRRRRSSSSLVSTGSSSAQNTAKSCRQIRRRETRSAMDELQIDTSIRAVRNNEEAACTECFAKSLDTGADTSRVGSEDSEEKDLVDSTKKNTDSHYINHNFVNMESALEHQARLIGKYQSEENAQREWEEKFGENNSCTPDSLDAGNQSDVTEERDEIKASVPPSTTENVEPADVHFPKEPEDQSPVPEFTFSKSKNESNKEESLPDSQGSSHVGSHSSLQKGTEASGSKKELTLVPHGSSSNLESVLKALNQAKMSLKQDLNKTPLLEGGRAIIQAPPPPPPEEFSVQRLNGLFRVPTDYQYTEARLRYSTEPDHATSYMQPNLNTDPYLSVQPFRYPDSRTPELERSLPSSGRYPYLEPHFITSLPPRFDPRLDPNVPSSSLRLDNLPTFDRGMDSGRSPYYDRRLTSTTSFDHGLGLGVPSSGIPPYLDHRLSSITSLPSIRYDPASDLGVPYSGRSPYLGHDLSTNLPSRSIEPSLDLRMNSNARYTTYQDPRLSAVTGAPSSSRYSPDPTHLAMQSDNRTLTSREDGMMPPAAAAAATTQFSFYDQDNSNTPNMYR
jgi:hypothetical protein